MQSDPEREWAVVVGASGAIGRHIVERFRSLGLGVVAVGRKVEALEEVSDGRPEIVVCSADIRTDEGESLIRRAIPGTVRIAVNSAAAPMGGPILDSSPEAIREATDVKVNGTLRLVRAVRERLTVDSRIVAIGGNLGYDPIPEASTAGVANAALANAVRQLSRALGPQGVTCHVVAPGPVWTERLQSMLADASASRGVTEDEILKEFQDRSPIGHLVTIDEVVWAVELLLAPEARTLAGGTLLLDAGQRTAIPRRF